MNKNRKLINAFLVSTMMLSGLALDVSAAETPSVERLSGGDRVETAFAVSDKAYTAGSNTVVLAGWNGQVDALTGTLLASANDAPLLFVSPGNLTKVKAQITELGASEVILLGGTAAISQGVQDNLANDFSVRRVKGAGRYGTAAAVAKEVTNGSADHVFITNDGWKSLADALVAGPVSGDREMPILVTGTDSLNPVTLETIKDLGATKATIVGGSGVVSEAVKAELEAADLTVDRVSGTTRFGTATNVAQRFFPGSEKAIIANDTGFADALVGGYFGAKEEAPILFTPAAGLNTITRDYLDGKAMSAYVIGGPSAVSNATLAAIKTVVDENNVVEELAVESVSVINATTLSVTFEGVEEPVEITLEEALVHGENEVTFTYEEQEFTVTVNHADPAVVLEEAKESKKAEVDAVELDTEGMTEESVEAAEAKLTELKADAKEAIDALEAVEEVEAYEFDASDAEDLLVTVEDQEAADLAAAIEAAEEAIAALPSTEDLTKLDEEDVDAARDLVDAVLALDEDAEIKGLEDLVTAESEIEKIDKAITEYVDAVNRADIDLDLSDYKIADTYKATLAELVTATEGIDNLIVFTAAEKAVEAYEDAPLTNAEEVIAAEKSRAEVLEAVALVAVEDAKAALEDKVEAQDAVVAAAREVEEGLALDLINSSTKFNIIERLEAPILGLENINPELADEYQTARAANFSDTKEQVQEFVIDLVNKEEADKEAAAEAKAQVAIDAQMEEVNKAVADYKKAPNATAQGNAVSAMNTALLALLNDTVGTIEDVDYHGALAAVNEILEDYETANKAAYMKAFVKLGADINYAQVKTVVETVNAEVVLEGEVLAATTKVKDLFTNYGEDTEELNATQNKIDTAKEEVEALDDAAADAKAELLSEVERAQVLLDEKTAAADVLALFTDGGKTAIKPTTVQGTIDAAKALVNKLDNVELKSALLVDIADAQSLLAQRDLGQATEDAKSAVKALFTSGDAEINALEIKPATTQDEIDDARAKVVALPKSVDDRAEFLARADKAQELFDAAALLEATNGVKALFSDYEAESEAIAAVEQTAIDAAKVKVDALKDSDAKTALLADIERAQGLFDAKLAGEAATAVDGLFTEDIATTDIADLILVTETTQVNINDAKDLVETDVTDATDKATLEALIVKAQELLEDKVNVQVEALFDNYGKETEAIKDNNQVAITEAKEEVEKLNDSTVKTDLLAEVARAQDLRLTADVNAVASKGDMDAELAKLKYANLINLGTDRRTEVSKLFFEVHGETDFKNTTEIKAAIDAVIAQYKGLITDVNEATTITEVQTALQAVVDAKVITYTNLSEDPVTYDTAELVYNAMQKEDFKAFKTITAINGAAATPAP